MREECSPVDALRALFPRGSMTGAPKIRSMQILENLEGAPRGVYSGVMGYLSQRGKDVNLAVMIRTVVLSQRGTSLAAGGAITAASDPAAEFAETLLKARPALRAMATASGCVVKLLNTDIELRPSDSVVPARPCLHGGSYARALDQDVELLETLAVTGDGRIVLLDYHHERLERSAAKLLFACPSRTRFAAAIQSAISEHKSLDSSSTGKVVRVTLSRSGVLTSVVRAPLPPDFPPSFALPKDGFGAFLSPVSVVGDEFFKF